jgi:hypothetical protein
LLHATEHFAANVVDKALHLPVHLFHALTHLQNDGNAGNVYTQVARG